jgi:ABC-type transport system involved in multi-copper enzyme maturation permease subunit
MRAYIAVIKDAFRAAIAAKLLYVMLVLITLFLMILAPLSYRTMRSSRMRQPDLRQPVAIAERLLEAGQSPESHPWDARVWERLSERTQERIQAYVEPESTDEPGDEFNRINQFERIVGSLVTDFRTLISDDTFYDPRVFADLELNEEGQDLVEQMGSLSSEESARLNRLLLEAIYATELARSPATVIRFTYLGMELPSEAIVISQRELQLFSTITIPWILDKLVLSIGVLVAILFTANMVPETLEPGSLNLLLSKPIRRWGLFLSKYMGACVFSLINALLLFVGIWLLLGVRLDIWNAAFLLCIPLYVFVFAIYYSLSAFVGLVFRSPILSVVSAILFWAFCFGIGVTHDFISVMIETGTPGQLIVDGGQVVKFDRTDRGSILDPKTQEWTEAFRSPEMEELPAFFRGFMPGSPMLGLTYDAEGQRFFGAQVPFGDLGARFSTNRVVMMARAENDWLAEQKMKAPAMTRAVFRDVDGSLLFVTYRGRVFQLPVERIDEFDAQQTLDEAGIGLPTDGVDNQDEDDVLEYFTEVSPLASLPPEEIEWISWEESTRRLAFYGNGRLTLLHWDGERFQWADRDRYGLPREVSARAIAMGGDHVWIGAGNESLFDVALESGIVTEFPWPSQANIVSMVGASDGSRVVILDANGVVWQWEQGKEVIAKVSVRGQGKIRAIAVGNKEQFWVVDENSLVHAYNWKDARYAKSAVNSMGFFQAFYVYGVEPIYWLSPKPGEFYRVVTVMAELARPDEIEANPQQPDAVPRDVERRSAVQNARSPWLPIWNGLAFIAIMLALSVVYFERQDF